MAIQKIFALPNYVPVIIFEFESVLNKYPLLEHTKIIDPRKREKRGSK
jgi:hypothetical protein